MASKSSPSSAASVAAVASASRDMLAVTCARYASSVTRARRSSGDAARGDKCGDGCRARAAFIATHDARAVGARVTAHARADKTKFHAMLRAVAKAAAASTRRAAHASRATCPSDRLRALSTSADASTTATEGEGEGEGEDGPSAVNRKLTESARAVRKQSSAAIGQRRDTWGWLYDLTDSGETAERWVNGANARLSDRVKTAMYLMHKEDPETWTMSALATKYKIREQRVGAIVALKRSEERFVENNETLYHDLETLMEQSYGTVDVGTGERHVTDVPTTPMFQTVSEYERGRAARPKKFVEASELARREEKVLVREFFERLRYNTLETGTNLNRVSRRASAPRRPEGGYALHVTPLGDTPFEPYIANKDGTQRALNDDEREYVRRRTPKPRRRIL